MTRQYDLFEVLQNGSKLWMVSITGREAAIEKLKEFEIKRKRRIIAIHLETREVISAADGDGKTAVEKKNPA